MECCYDTPYSLVPWHVWESVSRVIVPVGYGDDLVWIVFLELCVLPKCVSCWRVSSSQPGCVDEHDKEQCSSTNKGNYRKVLLRRGTNERLVALFALQLSG